MKLALVQQEVDGGDVEGNVARAREGIERAVGEGADLIALPEIFNVGYFAFDSYARHAEPLGGPTLSAIAALAADHGVAVLAGSIVEDLAATAERLGSDDGTESGDGRDGTRGTGADPPAREGYANTAVLFDGDGRRRLVYRKHHLFGYESAERELLTPGETVSVAELGEHVVGVTTCYDLRFPGLYRRLADDGATLVLVPSAWPYPRVEHWRLLPRARAVENLAYVAAVNGVGAFESAELLGRSAVYDPWGTTVASSGDRPTVLTARIDAERVGEVREEFPALADRRLNGD